MKFTITIPGTPSDTPGFKDWMISHAIDQRPAGHKMTPGAIGIDIVFVFPLPETTSPKDTERYIRGCIIHETSKAYLNNNTWMIDALNGIVWTMEQIAEVHSKKIYGHEPHVKIEVYSLPKETEPVKPKDEPMFDFFKELDDERAERIAGLEKLWKRPVSL